MSKEDLLLMFETQLFTLNQIKCNPLYEAYGNLEKRILELREEIAEQGESDEPKFGSDC